MYQSCIILCHTGNSSSNQLQNGRWCRQKAYCCGAAPPPWCNHAFPLLISTCAQILSDCFLLFFGIVLHIVSSTHRRLLVGGKGGHLWKQRWPNKQNKNNHPPTSASLHGVQWREKAYFQMRARFTCNLSIFMLLVKKFHFHLEQPEGENEMKMKLTFVRCVIACIFFTVLLSAVNLLTWEHRKRYTWGEAKGSRQCHNSSPVTMPPVPERQAGTLPTVLEEACTANERFPACKSQLMLIVWTTPPLNCCASFLPQRSCCVRHYHHQLVGCDEYRYRFAIVNHAPLNWSPRSQSDPSHVSRVFQVDFKHCPHCHFTVIWHRVA